MNINNENKFLFEDEKINGVIINETIDTIPLYDERSFCNVSFKEDVNELFSKNNLLNKKPLLNDNIKKELNKNNRYATNINTIKKNKKKNVQSDINEKNEVNKLNTNFWMTPNKDKNNQITLNVVQDKNENNNDRENNNENINKINNKKIILENNNSKEFSGKEDLTKYKNNTHQVRTVYDKMQLKFNEPLMNNYNYNTIEEKEIDENMMKNNDDLINKQNIIDTKNDNNLIIINKANNKDNSKNKKDLYINTQYCPTKKIILFSNSTTNNNNNRLSTNPNKNDKILKNVRF